MNTRKLSRIILLFALLIIYSLTLIYYLNKQNSSVYMNYFINESEYESIKNSRTQYNGELISSISFNDIELFKVSGKDEFFYSLNDKERSSYNPYINYSKIHDDVVISVLNKPITNELINNNEPLKVIVYNEQYYKEYDIVVTTLPIINISYEDNDVNSEKVVTKDEVINGEFYLYDNDNNRSEDTNLAFHVRGGLSTFYPKKSYKLTLKNNEGNSIKKNLLNMREDDDWILQADYSDQDMVRNTYSSRIWYDLFSSNNKYNIKAGTYSKYVELFMNGEYQGLYSLLYPIDDKQLNANKEDYLFKKNSFYDEKNEYLDYSKLINAWQIKSDKVDSNKAISALRDYFDKINRAWNTNEIYKYLDFDNIYDYYIFCMFVQHVDIGKNQFLLMKYDESKKNYVSLYIPWDLDMTFGNTWNQKEKNEISTTEILVDNNDIDVYNSPVNYLMDLNSIETKKNIKNKLNTMIDVGFNKDYLNKLVDEYQKDIFESGAYNRNKNRWPDSSQDTRENLSDFRNYVMDRYDSLLDFINK